MKLRALKEEDAPFMLEWMHDSDVVGNLNTNFAEKTIFDCYNFIKAAQQTKKNMHLAIVNDLDIYMGTVSLKHITRVNAEFAITIRQTAMGKGYSKYALEEAIRIGIEELHLQYIYWCVDSSNERAIKFYEKNSCVRMDLKSYKLYNSILKNSFYNKKQLDEYIWYIAE